MIWISAPRSRAKNTRYHTNPDCKHITETMPSHDEPTELTNRYQPCKDCTQNADTSHQPGWSIYKLATSQ